MALGIDGAAHAGALDAGGVTIAVLGCGTDIAYPRSHRGLYARILEHGLVVSEYPPGTAPAPWRFPARKRDGLATTRKPALLHDRPNAVDALKRRARVVPVWSREIMRCSDNP